MTFLSGKGLKPHYDFVTAPLKFVKGAFPHYSICEYASGVFILKKAMAWLSRGAGTLSDARHLGHLLEAVTAISRVVVEDADEAAVLEEIYHAYLDTIYFQPCALLQVSLQLLALVGSDEGDIVVADVPAASSAYELAALEEPGHAQEYKVDEQDGDDAEAVPDGAAAGGGG